jgi:hypothetical protein
MTVPEIYLVPLAGRNWRVAEDFDVQTVAAVDLYTDGIVKIPAGFICDLNSMPRFLWWASTPTDYPEAGAVHDFLYDQQVPRDVADQVYREVLVASGMGAFRASARYRALRIFGGAAYRSHAKPKPAVTAGTPHTDALPPVGPGA